MDVRDTAVGIPFEVVYLCAVEDLADSVKDAVDHFFAGIVEDQLVPAAGRFLARDGQGPVRVRLIETAVLTDHLRFDPEAELHGQVVDGGTEFSQRPAEFFFVDEPVAEGLIVIVPGTEPAVVEDHHVDAEVSRLFREVQEAVAVKVEQKGFPAVDEDGTGTVFPDAPADVLPNDTVMVPGQFAKAAATEAQDDFRCHEPFARQQFIGQPFFGKTHLQTGLAELVLLRFREETAAVDELHGPATAGAFRGALFRQDHEGIVLVGRIAPGAAYRLPSVPDFGPLQLTFIAVLPVEDEQVISPVLEVQDSCLELFDGHRCIATVFDDGAAGDDVFLREDPVKELHRETETLLLQFDRQGLDVLIGVERVDGRKTGQGILSRFDRIAGIVKVTADGTGGILHHERRAPEVAAALEREFLGQGVQRVRTVLPRGIRVHGETVVFEGQKMVRQTIDLRTVVKMQKVSFLIHHHLVGCLTGLQDKTLFLRIKGDRHSRTSFVVI